jgi:hypothetical protein
VAEVTGQVKLDGQPLDNALIQFDPVSGGTPSNGRTDTQGAYTLKYSRDVEGAVIGEHKVSISTYAEEIPDAEPPVPASPERVPAKYNLKTELKRQVEEGSNTIDFELDSQGEVLSPESAPLQQQDSTC